MAYIDLTDRRTDVCLNCEVWILRRSCTRNLRQCCDIHVDTAVVAYTRPRLNTSNIKLQAAVNNTGVSHIKWHDWLRCWRCLGVPSPCEFDQSLMHHKVPLRPLADPGGGWGAGDASRGGATDFKVGVQNKIRERSERKKILYPPLFQMWGYKEANISDGLLNILQFTDWFSH